IELAIAALNSQESPNIAATAREFGIIPSTLYRRFKGKTVSRADYTPYNRLLNDNEEKILVQFINLLSNRSLPPTVHIYKINL
ncbi:hypothetical protein K402DRAFT_333464, partial [Aulographum hederae CBS 113979]